MQLLRGCRKSSIFHSSSPIGCDLWQGTEKARINGYSGELDANISYIG